MWLFPVLAGCSDSGAKVSVVPFSVVDLAGGGVSWGAAFGDVDGDGDPDLYVGNHHAPAMLYRNDDGELVPWKAMADHVGGKGDGHGAAFADFDADGDVDLLEVAGAALGSGANPNRLLVNQGGWFRGEAAWRNLDAPTQRGRTPLWLDWNRDGRLDVFFANVPRDGVATEVWLQTPQGRFVRSDQGQTAAPTLFAQLADITGDGVDEVVTQTWPYPGEVLEVGTGARVAHDFPELPGVQDALWFDFDNDGVDDVFTVRRGQWGASLQQPDVHSVHAGPILAGGDSQGIRFETKGRVTVSLEPAYLWKTWFVQIGASGRASKSMEIVLDPSDPTTHGMLARPRFNKKKRAARIGYDPRTSTWTILLDFQRAERAIGVVSTEPIERAQPIGWTPDPPMRRQVTEDRLFLHRPDGWEVRPLFDTPCWTGVAGDFDNDMDVDVFLGCTDNGRNTSELVLWNDGTGAFTKEELGGTERGQTDLALLADVDGDGFVDVFVSNGGSVAPFNRGRHQLFRNTPNGNHWLQLDVPLGAVVTATAGGVTQRRVNRGGMHRYGQDFPRVHFGLGEHTEAEVAVTLPDGTRTRRTLQADTITTW